MSKEELISFKTVIPEKEEERMLPNTDGTAETYHKVLAKTSIHWEYDQCVDVWADYLIVQCRGSKDVSFCRVTHCSEDWDHDRDGGRIFNESVDVYPRRRLGRTKIKRDDLLPELVGNVYDETLSAFQNEISVLTGIGIRAIVETICKDQNCAGKDLKEKIDDLQSKGFITQSGADILHDLRFMGNRAAHEVEKHTVKELEAAFHVVEHLINTVYILPVLAKEIKK